MKILIGIMYCIENEFDQCIESIKAQTYTDYNYFVIKNLPNKEAHDKLYQTFMDNSSEYGLFIKVDADMVLTKLTFFEDVVKFFTHAYDIDSVEIAIHDFFTNRLVYGLHVYRSHIQWVKNDENIFVDHMLPKTYNHLHDNKVLAPAALHCPNPSLFQSYHFGVHKAVKFMQNNQNLFLVSPSKAHWNNIALLSKHYKQTKDNRLAAALAGITDALKYKFTTADVDYTNPNLKYHFRNLSEKSISLRANLFSHLFTIIPRKALYHFFLLGRVK